MRLGKIVVVSPASSTALGLVIVLIALAIVGSVRASGRIASGYGEDPSYWQRRSLAWGFMGWFMVRLMLSRKHGR